MIPIYVAEMAVRTNTRGRGVNAMIAAASGGTALAYWVYGFLQGLRIHSVTY